MSIYPKKIEGFPTSFQHQNTIDTISMVYHNVVIDISKTDDDLCDNDIATINNYVLLLPKLG